MDGDAEDLGDDEVRLLSKRRVRPEGDHLQSPLETYLREINETRLLTAQEEQSLARRVGQGDAEARDRMVRANLRLVVNIARNYAGKGLGLQDLIEEGNLGLLRAVEGFDPEMGTRFSTYASYWIKQSILEDHPHSCLHGRIAQQMATSDQPIVRGPRTGSDPRRDGSLARLAQEEAPDHQKSDPDP
jgi:RNA polymerase sigma factor (sigma-70 family)